MKKRCENDEYIVKKKVYCFELQNLFTLLSEWWLQKINFKLITLNETKLFYDSSKQWFDIEKVEQDEIDLCLPKKNGDEERN